MNINDRLTKLEDQVRAAAAAPLSKAERDARYAAFVDAVRPVATVVRSPAELEGYLKSITPPDDADVVSLEAVQRRAAITGRFARMIFEEVREPPAPDPKAA